MKMSTAGGPVPAPRYQPLPVVRVGRIPTKHEGPRWLVQELWDASSVGVIGGAPKCSKTWLGLDLALSVATGTPCLGKYAVPQPGPVLAYLAEDALPVLREPATSAAPPPAGNGATQATSTLACPRDSPSERRANHPSRQASQTGIVPRSL